MKQVKFSRMAAVTWMLVFGATGLFAQQTQLTRSQWLKKVGASVTDESVLRETAILVAPDDKVDFARRVVRAASRLPVGPEEKSAALVKAANGVIAGASGEVKQQVIAEVFAGVPVDHLPAVTEELAKRFGQEHNQLSNEQYEQIASDTLKAAVARNADTDAPSVRNTFVIIAFLKNAKDPALQNKLISQLPTERQRNLAALWIPPALKDKDYEALLAASDVEPAVIREDRLLSLVGHHNLDRLLADLTANMALKPEFDETTNIMATAWIPLSQIRATGGIVGSALSKGQLDHAPDFGINRTPRTETIRVSTSPCCVVGYQNQGTSVSTSSSKWVTLPLPERR